jgi:uncharacterized membrane protein
MALYQIGAILIFLIRLTRPQRRATVAFMRIGQRVHTDKARTRHASSLQLYIIVAVLLLATALRLANISAQSIWFDEGWSAYAASQPTLSDAARADLTNPPLYYTLLNAAARYFGDSEFALRWISTLFCLLTIAIAYRLTRELYSRRAATYAAILTTFSALLWWASQEARMYTLLALLVTICAWAWQRLLRRPSRGAWLALWVAELALLYSHNTGPITVVWLNAVTLLAWLAHRSFTRPDWRVWLAGQTVVTTLWLPYLNLFGQLTSANSAVTSAPAPSVTLLGDIWQAFWIGIWSLVNQDALLIALCAVIFVIYVALVDWRSGASRWLVLHTLLLTIGIVAGLILLANELHARYLVMIAPLLLIPFAAGIARLPRLLRPLALLPPVALFALVIVRTQDPLYQHDDVRGMVRYYAETLNADDVVMAWSYADRYDLAYYWGRLGVQAQRVTLPEGADYAAVQPLIPPADSISLNIWYTQRADYRGMMPCLLAHETVNEPVSFTTYGMTNLRFDAPSRNLPPTINSDIVFTQSGAPLAHLIAHGALPNTSADRATCLPLEIELLASTSVQLKAALIARNALGWEIDRADAIFAQADQRTSDQLSADERLTAYPLLRLPYGAPAGGYNIYLRLYDDALMPSGYEPAPDNTTSGRDVLLGTWTAGGGSDWLATNRLGTLPNEVNIPLDDITLLRHDLELAPVPRRNGDRISLSLLWEGDAPLPNLTLRDSEGRWSITVPPIVTQDDSITLDWRVAQIPLDALTGTAELLLPDGTLLARYPIEEQPALYEQPSLEINLNTQFPSMGELVGYTLAITTVSLNENIPITLIWRAGDAPIDTDYTVFVQLINDDGIVIAQSDAQPAAAARPTSGWRAGEYIIDAHTLIFNEQARVGSARFIVGMYDAQTNRRILTSDGQDFARLPSNLVINP